MKNTCFLLVVAFTYSLNASEQFNRAKDKEIFIEGGIRFSNSAFDFKNGNNTDFYITDNQVLLEYGLSKFLAVGAELNYISATSTGEPGFSDHKFYLNGEYKSFYWQGNLFLSNEANDDNNFSGGDHFSLELGYVLNGFGTKLDYIPSYEYDYQDVSEKLETGSYLALSGFYELNYEDNIYAVLVGIEKLDPSTEDGKDIGFESKYYRFEAYANIKAFNFEFLPTVGRRIGYDLDKVYDSIRSDSLSLKARFRF